MLIKMLKNDALNAVIAAIDYWENTYLPESKATYIQASKAAFKPKRRWLGLLPPNKFELTDAEAELEWTTSEGYSGIFLDSPKQMAINTKNRKIHKLISLEAKILADSFPYISLEDHDFELISGFLTRNKTS